jgi:hypothetical protein
MSTMPKICSTQSGQVIFNLQLDFRCLFTIWPVKGAAQQSSARGTRVVIVSVIPIINTIVVNVEPTASISRDRITVVYQPPYHSS